MDKIIFLGNIYGLHDGYDGSVFSVYGIAKACVASYGGVMEIIVENKDERKDVDRICKIK